MKQPDFLNTLAKKLCENLPQNCQLLKKDLENNFHAILQSTFNKCDIVTREEFDAQTRVLARCQKRMKELEKIVEELEKNTKIKNSHNK